MRSQKRLLIKKKIGFQPPAFEIKVPKRKEFRNVIPALNLEQWKFSSCREM